MRPGRSGLPLQLLLMHNCFVHRLDLGYDSLGLIAVSVRLGWIQFGNLQVPGPKLCYSTSMSRDAKSETRCNMGSSQLLLAVASTFRMIQGLQPDSGTSSDCGDGHLLVRLLWGQPG